MAAPAAAAGIASLLKSVPGVGTLSGGVLQGLVQVLVTRWIGNVFIVYFRNELTAAPTDWASLARAQWVQVTRPEELMKLVKTGIAKLSVVYPEGWTRTFYNVTSTQSVSCPVGRATQIHPMSVNAKM